MPLSEHEQRLLEQMERALYAEDPKFASSLRGRDPRSSFRRRVVVAVAGFLVGVALLMTGLVAQVVAVSVVGFLAMLGSALFAVTSYRSLTSSARLGVVDPGGVCPAAPGVKRPRAPRTARAGGGRSGFMQRMEERWNRRRDDNGR